LGGRYRGGLEGEAGWVAIFIGWAEHLLVIKCCFVALSNLERKFSVMNMSRAVASRAPVGDVVQVGQLGKLLVHLVH